MFTPKSAEPCPRASLLPSSCDLSPAVHIRSRATQVPQEDLGTHAPHCGGLCPGGPIPTVLVMHPLCMFTCRGLGRPARLRTNHSPNRGTRCAILSHWASIRPQGAAGVGAGGGVGSAGGS